MSISFIADSRAKKKFPDCYLAECHNVVLKAAPACQIGAKCYQGRLLTLLDTAFDFGKCNFNSYSN